ncbi:NfeD family protein [Virgibacillus sp. DJP39]|uniref:NfeD family protein n=1 Tax=Virgibacillus sp. DJP39 TaxID=3409790 RepID=UPI003BB69657
MSSEYEGLLYKKGVAINNLRPVGTIRINNQDYSAVSNGQWIIKDTPVKVVQVDGTKVLVEKIISEQTHA